MALIASVAQGTTKEDPGNGTGFFPFCPVIGSNFDNEHQIEVSRGVLTAWYWRVRSWRVEIAAGLGSGNQTADMGWSDNAPGPDGFYADENELPCHSSRALQLDINDGAFMALQVHINLTSTTDIPFINIPQSYQHSSGLWIPQISVFITGGVDFGSGIQAVSAYTTLFGVNSDASTTAITFDGFSFADVYTNTKTIPSQDMGGTVTIEPASYWGYNGQFDETTGERLRPFSWTL